MDDLSLSSRPRRSIGFNTSADLVQESDEAILALATHVSLALHVGA